MSLIGALLDAVLGPRPCIPDARGPDDPPAPRGHNCDVMAVLPDGRRGYYSDGHLWTMTGTTLHSPQDAEASARSARREHGDHARFFATNAEYSDPWEPICTIDGGPPTIVKCDECDCWIYGDECPSCAPRADEEDESP